MILAIILAVYSYTTIKCTEDHSKNSTKTALLVVVIAAIIHCFVAWWFQSQILREMTKQMDVEYTKEGIPPYMRTYEIKDNEAGRKRSAICEILKYDFVF